MPTLDQIKSDSLYCMFTGEPGVRKSTQALSFPKPIYWFDTDGKMQSLKLPAQKWGVNFKDVNGDEYDSWDNVLKKLEQFELNCSYKTIVIDSITSMGDVINNQTKRLKAGTTNAAGGEKGKRIGGIQVNSMEDYNAEMNAFQSLVSLTKAIKSAHNANIVLIAHVIGERLNATSNTYEHAARIIVTGGKNISAKISAYALEVYHFNVERQIDASKEEEYGLFTVHTGMDFARTSLPLPRYIKFGNEPLYDKWIKPAIDKLNNPTPQVK